MVSRFHFTVQYRICKLIFQFSLERTPKRSCAVLCVGSLLHDQIFRRLTECKVYIELIFQTFCEVAAQQGHYLLHMCLIQGMEHDRLIDTV